MESTELRIGNNFQDSEENILTVHGIANGEQSNIVWYDHEMGFFLEITECDPIPITPERLVRLGFKLIKGLEASKHHRLGRIHVEFITHNRAVARLHIDKERDLYLVELQYVHQLQNLYFDLERKELTLKKIP